MDAAVEFLEHNDERGARALSPQMRWVTTAVNAMDSTIVTGATSDATRTAEVAFDEARRYGDPSVPSFRSAPDSGLAGTVRGGPEMDPRIEVRPLNLRDLLDQGGESDEAVDERIQELVDQGGAPDEADETLEERIQELLDQDDDAGRVEVGDHVEESTHETTLGEVDALRALLGGIVAADGEESDPEGEPPKLDSDTHVQVRGERQRVECALGDGSKPVDLQVYTGHSAADEAAGADVRLLPTESAPSESTPDDDGAGTEAPAVLFQDNLAGPGEDVGDRLHDALATAADRRRDAGERPDEERWDLGPDSESEGEPRGR